MSTGNFIDFGDLATTEDNGTMQLFKWSWRSWLVTKIQETAEYLLPFFASVTP